MPALPSARSTFPTTLKSWQELYRGSVSAKRAGRLCTAPSQGCILPYTPFQVAPAEPGQLLPASLFSALGGSRGCMCSEFPTSRNPKATVTHRGCSPTEAEPPGRDAANPLFWGTQHLPKLQHSEGQGQLMQQPLSPEHGTALWALQVPPTPTCSHSPSHLPQKGAGGAGELSQTPHTRLRGLPGTLSRRAQPPGRTYEDGQVEEDHHDLDKGEAPHLCTWGE